MILIVYFTNTKKSEKLPVYLCRGIFFKPNEKISTVIIIKNITYIILCDWLLYKNELTASLHSFVGKLFYVIGCWYLPLERRKQNKTLQYNNYYIQVWTNS